jgi:hypothetical protein
MISPDTQWHMQAKFGIYMNLNPAVAVRVAQIRSVLSTY